MQASRYPMLALFEFKLFSKYPTIIETIPFFGVTAMFRNMQTTLSFNFQRDGLCLQVLRMRVNIHIGPPCWDDAITRKKSSQRN